MNESPATSAVAQPAAIFDNLRLARWLLGQGQTAIALTNYYDEFKKSEGVREKWYRAARPAGDLVVDVIDTIPVAAAAAEEQTEAFRAQSIEAGKAQAAALSIDWDKVLEVSEKFLPALIQVALRLRG